jgi:type II secretory pathway predicted ATPase ExeA/cytoskeletal protein CcmA (bactofilin family)
MVMVEKNLSMIDRLMTIIGEVTCSGRLLVKGKIDGSFTGGTVVIGKSGKINGKITADEIECSGHIEGDVVTGKFIMRKNGFHLGTVKTKLLEVDPGANIDCVLQRDISTTSDHSVPRIDLERVWSVFDEREKCRAMDVPLSERKDLFDDLVNLLKKGKPLIKITGEKGSGKTTFIRLLSERLAPITQVFVIDEPVGSVKDLLLTFAADLGIIPDKRESQKEIVQRIRAAVCGQEDEEVNIVLAVDDAHMMYPATMEGLIRSLTNVYGGGKELLQLIFFGTDEIDGKLVHTTREYFEDETNCLLALEPLSIKDTAEYLRFCIQLASGKDARIRISLFPYETITKLQIQSKGNISRINRLAAKALRSAFKAGASEVGPRFI